MPEPTRKRARRADRTDGRATPERVRRDLLARGVSSAFAGSLAARIAPRAARLSPDAYASFLDGVAAAHGGREPSGAAEAGAAELQRLMQDFASELKKLDEGLRLLSAYLLRIRDRTARDGTPTVH